VASDFRLLNGCTAVIFVAVLVQRLGGAQCGGWTPLDSDTKLFNEYRRTSDAKVVETRCERQLHAVDQTVLPNPFAFHAAKQSHRGKLTKAASSQLVIRAEPRSNPCESVGCSRCWG